MSRSAAITTIFWVHENATESPLGLMLIDSSVSSAHTVARQRQLSDWLIWTWERRQQSLGLPRLFINVRKQETGHFSQQHGCIVDEDLMAHRAHRKSTRQSTIKPIFRKQCMHLLNISHFQDCVYFQPQCYKKKQVHAEDTNCPITQF